MAKDTFVRNKIHIKLALSGMWITEKTTLTAGITKVLALAGNAEASGYDDIDNAPEEKARGITIQTAHVEWPSLDSLDMLYI